MNIDLNRVASRINHEDRIIDMTADGAFRTPPPTPLANRILRWAIVIGVLAAGLAVAALMLWFALILIPIALGAGLIAYAAFRYRMWKAGASLRREGDGFRR